MIFSGADEKDVCGSGEMLSGEPDEGSASTGSNKHYIYCNDRGEEINPQLFVSKINE